MIWAQADYFRIPLLDGRYGVGQVFELDNLPDDTLFCGLSDQISGLSDPVTPFKLSDITAFAFIKASEISRETWPPAGFLQIPTYKTAFDLDALRRTDFTGVTVHEPAVIEAFVNAWHGLYEWTAFGDLFNQIKRPDIDAP